MERPLRMSSSAMLYLLIPGLLLLCLPPISQAAGPPAATQPAATSTTQPAQSIDFSQLTAQLNDFHHWTVGAGNWHLTPEGHIRGEGESSLSFTHDLPRDFLLEFRMNILEGMRPRIFLPKSGMYVGNEGFSQNIYPYEVLNLRGVHAEYIHDREMLIGIKLSGNVFELYVDGELMARGTRKSRPDSESLTLSSGDGWSKGVAEFWQFKISPVD